MERQPVNGLSTHITGTSLLGERFVPVNCRFRELDDAGCLLRTRKPPVERPRKIAKKKSQAARFMLYLSASRASTKTCPITVIQPSELTIRTLREIEFEHVLSEDPSVYVQNACVTRSDSRATGMFDRCKYPRAGIAPKREHWIGTTASGRVPRKRRSTNSPLGLG